MSSEQLLANIRDGKTLTKGQMIFLSVMLSLPAIMSQLTSIAMQYIDAAMVGSLGAEASAAIGIVASSTWFFSGVSMSIVQGFSIQVAQYIGAKRFAKAREILHQSYYVVMGISLAFVCVGLLISSRLPLWLGGDGSIAANATMYFRIYIGFLPVMVMARLSGAMLQCTGNMKIPGIFNSLMCVFDVFFNFLFIFPARALGIGGMEIMLPGLGLGVAGAALGTGMASLVSMCGMVWFLLKRTPMLEKEEGEKPAFHREDVTKAFRIALPIAFERMVVSGGSVVTTRIVAPLGAVSIAANSLSVTAESLCYMPCFGIAEAASTITGQCIGAGRKETAKQMGGIILLFGMALMACSGTLLYLFAPQMIGFLTPDGAVQALGARVLRIEAFAEPLYGASIVAAGVLRGAGDTLIPSIMNLVSLWAVRIPLSFLLVRPYALIGVWIAMCVELCFRGTIFLIRFLRGRWIRMSNS